MISFIYEILRKIQKTLNKHNNNKKNRVIGTENKQVVARGKGLGGGVKQVCFPNLVEI